MKSNVLILGYFGYVTNQLDGQTIKTRTVFDLLKSKESEIGIVSFFDTQSFKKSKFNLLVLFWVIWKSKKLVYLPAHNNLKYLFPFVYILCKLRNIEIIYLVVGGWLSDYLKNKKLHVRFLKKIKGIFTESDSLKKNLERNYRFNNVLRFPNFRNHSFVPKFVDNQDCFKIVFMARVNRMKGIDTVFRLADYLERNPPGNKPIRIDFYGPIEKSDEEYFRNEVNKHLYTLYKGSIEPENIYQTLEQYDIMVLPTKYYTEGLPGSILDAYISGIPVIVTKWKHATEFVENAVTGYIVPFEQQADDFTKAVVKLYKDNHLLTQMKQSAYKKSKEYSSESAWKIIKKYLVNV